MNKSAFKYVYGPVFSWRLGRSLGIDPLSSDRKICNLDCSYCQLGATEVFSNERKVYVPTEEIVGEIVSFPEVAVDYITFSGRGEPTLAGNLGGMIRRTRKVWRDKIAVITNSLLISRPDVQADLAAADCVVAKLDAISQELFERIGRPSIPVRVEEIIAGWKTFRRNFSGRLAIQIMLVEENKARAAEFGDVIRSIGPEEVQLNTPLRPSAVRPLSPAEMDVVKKAFAGLPVRTVYDFEPKVVDPLDDAETSKRHGYFRA